MFQSTRGQTQASFRGIPKWFVGQVFVFEARGYRGQQITHMYEWSGLFGFGSAGLPKTVGQQKHLRILLTICSGGVGRNLSRARTESIRNRSPNRNSGRAACLTHTHRWIPLGGRHLQLNREPDLTLLDSPRSPRRY